VVFAFFRMECSRGAVVTLFPSGYREALMKSLRAGATLLVLSMVGSRVWRLAELVVVVGL
jgi:hypothetical protein